MSDPAMGAAMRSMMTDPRMMESMMNSDPRVRAMLDANPEARARLTDPAFLRQMADPANLRAMMQMQQAMQQLQSSGLAAGFPGAARAVSAAITRRRGTRSRRSGRARRTRRTSPRRRSTPRSCSSSRTWASSTRRKTSGRSRRRWGTSRPPSRGFSEAREGRRAARGEASGARGRRAPRTTQTTQTPNTLRYKSRLPSRPVTDALAREVNTHSRARRSSLIASSRGLAVVHEGAQPRGVGCGFLEGRERASRHAGCEQAANGSHARRAATPARGASRRANRPRRAPPRAPPRRTRARDLGETEATTAELSRTRPPRDPPRDALGGFRARETGNRCGGARDDERERGEEVEEGQIGRSRAGTGASENSTCTISGASGGRGPDGQREVGLATRLAPSRAGSGAARTPTASVASLAVAARTPERANHAPARTDVAPKTARHVRDERIAARSRSDTIASCASSSRTTERSPPPAPTPTRAAPRERSTDAIPRRARRRRWNPTRRETRDEIRRARLRFSFFLTRLQPDNLMK